MLFAAALMAFSAVFVSPASAQDSQDDTQLPEPEQRESDQVDAKVRQLIRKADEWTGKEARAKRCLPGSRGNDIVVCGETDPSAKFRVPPETEGRLATGAAARAGCGGRWHLQGQGDFQRPLRHSALPATSRLYDRFFQAAGGG